MHNSSIFCREWLYQLKYEKLVHEKCRHKSEFSMIMVYNAVLVKIFVYFDVEQDDEE